MTHEELATRLNGREYGEEITEAEEAEAKAAGLLVVFGASDDLCELRGMIHDEVGCYSGGEFVIVDGELFDEKACDSEDCPYAAKAKSAARVEGFTVEALWCKGEFSWTYALSRIGKATPPHATFDVMEDGDDKYCRGLVIKLPVWEPPF